MMPFYAFVSEAIGRKLGDGNGNDFLDCHIGRSFNVVIGGHRVQFSLRLVLTFPQSRITV